VKEFFQDRVVPLIIGIDHTVLPKVYLFAYYSRLSAKRREDILLIRVFFVREWDKYEISRPLPNGGILVYGRMTIGILIIPMVEPSCIELERHYMGGPFLS